MARDKREYEDDDGRTIANMEGVERPNLFSIRIPNAHPDAKPAEEGDRQQPEFELSREERKFFILGALKAALLIAAAFIVGLGLLIALLLLLWKH